MALLSTFPTLKQQSYLARLWWLFFYLGVSFVMQRRAKLLWLVCILLLSACVKPTQSKKTLSTPPPNQTTLRELMHLVGEQITKAGAVASDELVFVESAGQIAEAMKKTRDLYAPDPMFYQLADDAFQSATLSTQTTDNAVQSKAWSDTQKTCQQCHLRYGGPK
jgi:hypothetical protein